MFLCAEGKLSLPPASTANFKCQEKKQEIIALLFKTLIEGWLGMKFSGFPLS